MKDMFLAEELGIDPYGDFAPDLVSELEVEIACEAFISSFLALSEETKQKIFSDIPSFLSWFNLLEEKEFSLIDMDLSNVNLKKN